MSLVRLSGLAGITSAVLAIGALAGFAWAVGGQPLRGVAEMTDRILEVRDGALIQDVRNDHLDR